VEKLDFDGEKIGNMSKTEQDKDTLLTAGM